MTEPQYPEELRVSVSISRKINLGDYESADIFMAVSNLEPGIGEEEIEEALLTGDQAIQVLKRHVAAQVKKARRDHVEAG